MLRLIRGLGILLVILFIVLVVGLIYLRTSLPKIRGELNLQGLNAAVEVTRDQYGVPHIYADSPDDAYFALGFVHAQDRLWQMEYQRRVGAGRLAEIVGNNESAINADKFLRTLGVYRVAEKNYASLDAASQAALDAYTAGVNQYLETRSGPLPPEFLILRHQPELWTPADSLVWVKMMAWDLSGNWDDELLRARLLQRLEADQVADLWPPYPGDAPIALPDFSDLYQELPLAELLAVSPTPAPAGAGSNNWVVSGEKSITGQPLLANDPHLSLQAPSLWYFAHLSAPGLEVIGATLPGLPYVVLGRNERAAWGFTNTGSDSQDLFIERLDSSDASRYQTPGGFEAFLTREEVIKVRGQEDIVMTVRESRHGPIISDVSGGASAVIEQADFDGNQHALAFSWTALAETDRTFQAGLHLNQAQDWDSFVDALRDFSVPQQNIVYADVEGNIGYYAPAQVPIRASGDGTVPVPGWTGEYDWVGFIPFEDLPQAFNPASQQIMTANHKIVPDDYDYYITDDWTAPYRAERIEALLGRIERHSLQSFASIQADQLSLMASEFFPQILNLSPESDLGRQAQAKLLSWDGRMRSGEVAPLVFSAWYRELGQAIYADELGDVFELYWGFRPLFLRDVLDNKQYWCDDIRTPANENCDFEMTKAFDRAVLALEEDFGSNINQWTWGRAHPAVSAHRIFGDTALAPLFNLSLPNGGDAFTVNVASYEVSEDQDYQQTWAPAFRALYDLSDLNRSRYIHNSGQSGNPLSRKYRNLFGRWRDVGYIPMTTDPTEIQQGAMGTLRLIP